MRLAAASVLAALAIASSSVDAAPSKGEARVQFDRGVAAYTQGDYAAAADALSRSFALEADPETLFAWAQTERKLGKCATAIELYGKLLAMELPEENRAVVKVQIGECEQILAEEKAAAQAAAPLPAVPPDAPVTAGPTHGPTETAEGRAWWKDPVGGALVGVGAIGLGTGAMLLVQARAAERDRDAAATYQEFVALDERATSRGRLGVIAAAAGGAMVAAGVVWYVTRKSPADRTVTGWVAPGSGGLAFAGSF